jgi:hypothetical protein
VFDLVAGLPWHVLVVHAVVVVGPLAACAAVVYAVWGRSRSWLRWPLAVAAVVVFVSAIVANSSGEALQRRVEASVRSGATSSAEFALVSDHVDVGSVAAVVCAGFALGVLVCVFWLLPPRRSPVLAGVAHGLFPAAVKVAMVLVSLVVIGAVVWAGHSGAAAAWTGRLG